MGERETIQDNWEEISSALYSLHFPKEQLSLVRNVYFLGCFKTIDLLADAENEDNAKRLLKTWEKERKEFREERIQKTLIAARNRRDTPG